MTWLKYGPSLALAAALAGAVWYVMDLRADKAALTADKAALAVEVASAERQVASAKNATRVMKLRSELIAVAAHNYTQMREALIRGDFGNEILPDAFVAGFVCRLLPDTPNCNAGGGD